MDGPATLTTLTTLTIANATAAWPALCAGGAAYVVSEVLGACAPSPSEVVRGVFCRYEAAVGHVRARWRARTQPQRK